jgi:hypothetical protein
MEEGRNNVKTQRLNFRVFHNKVPGNFDEDGFGDFGKRIATFVSVQP